VRRSVLLASTVLAVFVFCSFTYAQTYLNATGAPTFSVPASVELGYVNLSNGNLHLNVPFGVFPQRGAIGFSAGMIYDSRIWQVVNNQWQPSNVSNSMGGWRFATSVDGGAVTEFVNTSSCGNGTLTTYQAYIWTMPDGTQHAFPITTSQNTCTGQNVTSGNAFAADSSGYHMYITNYTSATIFANNGNRVSPTDEDTNGNYFTVDGNGNAVDTLGRTPVTKTVNGNLTYYDVLNSQGTTSRYTVTSETINVSTNFGQSGVAEYSGTLTVVQSVGMPDGSSDSFGYDGYGEVNSVALRTGGNIAYTYTNFSDSYGNINRWVNQRVSAGGTWTYTPAIITTCSPGSVGCQQSVTITQPSTDDTVYTFTLNNGAWDSQVQSYTGSASSGTLLKTVAADFDFTNACPFAGCSGNAYIRPIRVTTTDPIPGSSISKKLEFGYDSIYYGNVNAQKEWLYYTGSPAATPDRETDTTFLTTSSYISKDILNRPTDMVVKNSSGTQVEETNIHTTQPL
jgi:hypothetical protein